MSTSIQITIPFPPQCLWPNSRVDRRRATDERQAFKGQVQLIALEAIQRGGGFPWPGAASAAAFFQPSRHHRDRDNANASLKYAHDAVVRAGLLENDRHMTHLAPLMLHDKENPRVVVSYIRLDDGSPAALNAFAEAMRESAARIARKAGVA